MWVRRTTRQLAIVVLTGILALVLGVFTASAETRLGPHEARISTNVTHTVDIDLGPLGSLTIPSPTPWPLGVRVDVGEIPATLTEVESPLQSLSGDVAAYAAFFADPGSAVRDAVSALVADALRRTVLGWSILLVLVAISQLGAGGLLRREFRSKLSRAGVAPLALATALAVLAVPATSAIRGHPATGRPSAVLAQFGGVFEEARVSGQVAALLDTYGELALEEVRKNEEFYAVLAANVRAAYAEEREPLAPRRPLAPVVPEPAEAEPEDEASDAATPDGAGDADTGEAGEAEDGDAGSDPTAGDAGSPEEGDAAATRAESGDAATASPSPSPTPSEASQDPDPVTFMVFSDMHCNTGMGTVLGEIARQAQADVILNAGDTTMGGSSVESICVDSIAKALPADTPVVVADGNHDSRETTEQERRVGWQVLDGAVVEVDGVQIVGNVDSRLTSVPLGNHEYATRSEAAQVLTDAACAAVEPGDHVDILLLHDPYTAARVMQSGCVGLGISGHLHRRVGPLQQGLGVAYLNDTSGGAGSGIVPLGPLQVNAYVSIIVYDRANKTPMALREITLTPAQEVLLGEWEPFPVRPQEPVTADLSIEAWPAR